MQDGWRPLHVAASHNKLDMVQLLVDEGADLFLTAGDEEKALDVADSEEMRKLLLRASAPAPAPLLPAA